MAQMARRSPWQKVAYKAYDLYWQLNLIFHNDFEAMLFLITKF